MSGAGEGLARSGFLLRSDARLRARTGRGVSVAVIDSGANAPHPHLPTTALAGAVVFDVEGRIAGTDACDRLGHGTAVAAAIHEKAPEARLWAVKVFDSALATSVPGMVRALDWATEQGHRLVNLSLGTPNPASADALAGAVQRARARGTLIVSAEAGGDTGEAWYPGSLPGVVAVRLEWGCPRDGVGAVRRPDGRRVLCASGFPRPIPNVPPSRNLHGVSFAVANATGLLALALEGSARVRSPEDALDVLLAGTAADSAPARARGH